MLRKASKVHMYPQSISLSFQPLLNFDTTAGSPLHGFIYAIPSILSFTSLYTQWLCLC